MMKFVRIAILLLILVGVAFGVLLYNLNTIIKSGVETVGPKVIGVEVLLEKSNISLFSGKGDLTGLVVKNPEGYKSAHVFSLGSVHVDLDAMTVLTGKEIHIREIIIDAPHIIYEGGISNSNIKAIMDNLKSLEEANKTTSPSEPAKKEGQDKKVVIDRLVVKNIKLGVSNKLLLNKTVNISLPDIEQRDIGKDSEKSLGDVIKDLLGSLDKSIIPAVKNSFGDLGGKFEGFGNTLKNATNLNAEDEAQKATDKATVEVKKVTDKATAEVQKVSEKVATETQKVTTSANNQVETATEKATEKATKAIDKGLNKIQGLFGK